MNKTTDQLIAEAYQQGHKSGRLSMLDKLLSIVDDCPYAQLPVDGLADVLREMREHHRHEDVNVVISKVKVGDN